MLKLKNSYLYILFTITVLFLLFFYERGNRQALILKYRESKVIHETSYSNENGRKLFCILPSSAFRRNKRINLIHYEIIINSVKRAKLQIHQEKSNNKCINYDNVKGRSKIELFIPIYGNDCDQQVCFSTDSGTIISIKLKLKSFIQKNQNLYYLYIQES